VSRRRSASFDTAPWTGDMSSLRFGEAVMPLTNYLLNLALAFEAPPLADLVTAIEIRSMACIALQLESDAFSGPR
jgi:hypothetical protein